MRRLLLEGDWRVNPFLPIAVVALFFSFTGTALFVVGECTDNPVRRMQGDRLVTVSLWLSVPLLALRLIV